MRGKHGQAAAVRHEVQSRDEEIAAYRRNIVKLTEENKRIKQQIVDERREGARRERVLKAQVDHVASPKIEALELIIGELRRRVAGLRADSEREAKLATKVSRLHVAHLMKDHHFTFEGAIRQLGPALGPHGEYVCGNLEREALEDHRSPEEVELAKTADAAIERRMDKQARATTLIKAARV